jgi:hypothetical protein
MTNSRGINFRNRNEAGYRQQQQQQQQQQQHGFGGGGGSESLSFTLSRGAAHFGAHCCTPNR